MNQTIRNRCLLLLTIALSCLIWVQGAHAYQCSDIPKVKCDKISYCQWVPDSRSKDGQLIKGYCQVKKSKTTTIQKQMKKPLPESETVLKGPEK